MFVAFRHQQGRSIRCHSQLFTGGRSYPVFYPETRHPRELPHVIGDDDQSFATRMAGDLHIVRAARRSRPFKLRPDLSVMRRRLVAERQNLQPRYEVLDRRQVLDAAG